MQRFVAQIFNAEAGLRALESLRHERVLFASVNSIGNAQERRWGTAERKVFFATRPRRKIVSVTNAVFGRTWIWPVAQERQHGREVSRREDRLPETFRSGSSGRVRPQPRSFQFHGRAGLWPGSCDFDGSFVVASSQVRLGSRAHGRRMGPLLLPRSKSEREYDQGDAKGDGVRAHPPSQDESSD